MLKNKPEKGLTLAEILITIGIISILAAGVIVTVNPGNVFDRAYESTRKMHMDTIDGALSSYRIDRMDSFHVLGIDENLREICNSEAVSECEEGHVDLSPLVPNYLSEIPVDPAKSEDSETTGYRIARSEEGFDIVHSGEEISILLVDTLSAQDVTETSATIGGSVVEYSDSDDVERFLEWGEEEHDLENREDMGTGSDDFFEDLTGLDSDTTYYFRAYAEEEEESDQGETLSFTTEEDLILTEIKTEDPGCQTVGGGGSWEDCWSRDVDVEEVEDMHVEFGYEITGDRHGNQDAEAGVRVIVDGNEIYINEANPDQTITEIWSQEVDVSGKDQVLIEFQFYSDSHAQAESEAEIEYVEWEERVNN